MAVDDRFSGYSNKEIVILDFRDHDPSGIDMTNDLSSRLRKYGKGMAMTVKRVALTIEQVRRYSLLPSPTKTADTRSRAYARDMCLKPCKQNHHRALDWERVAFVTSSDLRHNIMAVLKKGERTPAQLSEELRISRQKVDRVLNQLQGVKLVVCLTPHRRKGRVFAITERGYAVLETLRKAP